MSSNYTGANCVDVTASNGILFPSTNSLGCDMKLGVVIEEIVTSYLVSRTGPSFVHYGILLYIVYVTYSRMLVLYFRYRVNWGINMLVVFVCVI